MIFHMKTTLIIPDHIARELKRRAAKRGETLSAVVAETLRKGLEGPSKSAPPRPLPTHHLGRPRADLADRNALYDAMER